MTLNLFEMAALILAATTLACWINANTLKLPVAVGLLIVGLAFSGAIAITDMLSPGLGAGAVFRLLERQIPARRHGQIRPEGIVRGQRPAHQNHDGYGLIGLL
ncbi:MAG: hypothetical protein B7Z43_11010 [Sphingomonas sp. 12-62-6]|nr:MAG: hypothetical protein B7Z43_11010 [Sphingomonas sp. 12-62-6]